MCYVCGVCGDTFGYSDEVMVLDCNGNDAFDEEQGGSGDTYGVICNICYETDKGFDFIQRCTS